MSGSLATRTWFGQLKGLHVIREVGASDFRTLWLLGKGFVVCAGPGS